MSRSDEEALIDREFAAVRRPHSDSEGYNTYLSSGPDDTDSDDADSSSSSSNNNDDYSSSSSSSYDAEEAWSNTNSPSRASAIMRRRVSRRETQARRNSDDTTTEDESESHRRRRRGSSYPYRERCPYNRLVNGILVISFLLWLFVTILDWANQDPIMNLRNANAESLMDKLWQQRHRTLTKGEIARLRKERMKEAKHALGSAAGNGLLDSAKDGMFSLFGGPTKKKNKAEDLPPGCAYSDWQKLSFPNCNEIHEIDLRDSLHLHKYSANFAMGEYAFRDNQTKAEAKRIGYVGSGLWRHVWKIDPHGEMHHTMAAGEFEAPSVLKMMKAEHEVDERNMDRHRRDALVMERLTSSPYIVSMYGYCGNTVLTEYVGSDLDAVIDDHKGGKNSHGSNYYPTRSTPEGRVTLALGVAKGLQALHEAEDSPIIHADIVPKQYLVARDGSIKLNDFNRCRFVSHKNGTDEACRVKIPSAPGANRSPEEYEMETLTEKLDIYSVGNVLYEILTGEEPWSNMRTSEIKSKIKHGKKPHISENYLVPHTIDAKLAALIDLAYEHDPSNRISASELVIELESILQGLKKQ